MEIETFKRIKSGGISSLTSLVTSLILALLIVGTNHFFQSIMLIFSVLAISTGVAFVAGFFAHNIPWLYLVIYGVWVSFLIVGGTGFLAIYSI